MTKTVLMLICLFIAASETTVLFASELSVSDEGLGAISTDTRFDQKEIQGLLHGYVVKSEKESPLEDAYTVFVIMDHKSRLATIQSTLDAKKILCIRVTSNKVNNALGPRVGMEYGSIYEDVIHDSCIPGTDALSGQVICHAPNSKFISYVFKGQYAGPNGAVPDIVNLKTFVLNEIVWLP